MFAKSNLKNLVDRDGFAVVESLVSKEQLASLVEVLERISGQASVRQHGGVFAIRNLLEVVPEVSELTVSPAVRSLVQAILGVDCFPVRGILFDKIPGANWKVPLASGCNHCSADEDRSEGFWAVVRES